MTKRIAAIDIGTQTFRMAVAECSGHSVRTVGSWLENVRLGEGLAYNNILKAEAVQRGVRTIEKFIAIIEQQGGASITATGTAALRNAANTEIFLRAALKKGLDIKVISGRKEAEIAADGVSYTLRHTPGISMPPDNKIVIVDVGGGSSEISMCSRDIIKYRTSVDMGAVNMTEKFFMPDVDVQEGVDRLSSFVDSRLSQAIPARALHLSGICLAGVGGTITTIAAMESGMRDYRPEKIRGFILSRKCMEGWIRRLTEMTNSEKLCIPGLEPERSDIILAGMVIVCRIMEKLRLSSLITSDGGLLLGLLIRAIKKECISYAESSGPEGLYI